MPLDPASLAQCDEVRGLAYGLVAGCVRTVSQGSLVCLCASRLQHTLTALLQAAAAPALANPPAMPCHAIIRSLLCLRGNPSMSHFSHRSRLAGPIGHGPVAITFCTFCCSRHQRLPNTRPITPLQAHMVRHHGANLHDPETTKDALVPPSDTPTVASHCQSGNHPTIAKTFARRDQLQPRE